MFEIGLGTVVGDEEPHRAGRFMVQGPRSIGSSFCMTTRSPRAVRGLPRLAAVIPYPKTNDTNCQKMCLVVSFLGPAAEEFITGFDPIRQQAAEVRSSLACVSAAPNPSSGQQSRHLGFPLTAPSNVAHWRP